MEWSKQQHLTVMVGERRDRDWGVGEERGRDGAGLEGIETGRVWGKTQSLGGL